MTRKCECYSCEGAGRSPVVMGEPAEACLTCGGSGMIDEPFGDLYDCEACGGTGMLGDEDDPFPCPVCNPDASDDPNEGFEWDDDTPVIRARGAQT